MPTDLCVKHVAGGYCLRDKDHEGQCDKNSDREVRQVKYRKRRSNLDYKERGEQAGYVNEGNHWE